MCRFRCPAIARFVCAAALIVSLTERLAAEPDPPSRQITASRPQTLFLAVVINGAPSGQIAEFLRASDGTVAARRNELADIGIEASAGEAESDPFIDLSVLDGLSYRIDDVTQQIFFKASDGRLRPNVYDASAALSRLPDGQTATSGFGAVLNHTLFATTNADFLNWFAIGDHAPVVSAALEGRIFGPFGVMSQSALANTNLAGVDDAIRLDTTWSYSNPETLRTYRAGDFISGGLSWTRPVRFGGVQMQRNFDLQPDLVTLPVPEFGGSAAVPSTVEVYANNVRVFNQDIPAGPFVISNIPVVTGAGTAQVIVNDSLGRETAANLPFYTSPLQLREGLLDFSIEAGVPRRSYGVRSNDYVDGPAGSMSVRYGTTDVLTLEGHAEINQDLVNGGAGAVFPIGHLGALSLAAAGSHDRGDGYGALLAGSVEAGIGDITFHASTKRALGDYDDLASVSVRQNKLADGLEFYQAKPPRSVERAVLALPLGFDPSKIALSFTQLEDEDGDYFRTVGASYSRPITRYSSFYATGFSELGGLDNYGLFAGLSITLGNRLSSAVSVSRGTDGVVGGAEVSSSEEAHPGGYGWRLRDRESERPDRLASASYRTRSSRLQGTVQQYGDAVRATAEIDGAVVVAGGSVFLTPRIHDAFVLVDAGAPGVAVFHENRLAGTTDTNGQLIVPNLNAYEPNRISIDPANLPVDAEILRTKSIVVPADRAGVNVDFGIDTALKTALVTFRGADGELLPVGSYARLEESGEDFIIGYDGQAYLRGLSAWNTVRVVLATGGSCSARFQFPRNPGVRTVIENVSCR